MGQWSSTQFGLEDGSYIVGPSPSEDQLAYSYLKWKNDGLLSKVFYQGEPTVRQFLEWHTDAGKRVVGAYRRRISDVEFCGMGFVNTVESIPGLIKAEIGFCFDPSVNIFGQVSLIRACVTQFFLTSNVYSIFGTTPAPNEAAVAVVKRVGMRTFGPVPNFASWSAKPCDVWISQTDKDHWFNIPQIQSQFPLP